MSSKSISFELSFIKLIVLDWKFFTADSNNTYNNEFEHFNFYRRMKFECAWDEHRSYLWSLVARIDRLLALDKQFFIHYSLNKNKIWIVEYKLTSCHHWPYGINLTPRYRYCYENNGHHLKDNVWFEHVLARNQPRQSIDRILLKWQR